MDSLTSKKTTIKDVARGCGFSVATVSYVINGSRSVNAETRDKVLNVMKEMNYHPNAVARGLSSKRVHTIGVHSVVVKADQFITNPYAAGILSGILKRASQEGFEVTIFTNRWENVEKSGPSLRDGRTDGIIAIAPSLSCDMLDGVASMGIPLVAIASAPYPGIPDVDVDNYAGAKMAAQHLIELGHTRIAGLLGDDNTSSFAGRRGGFCDALAEANLPVNPEWVMTSHFNGKMAFDQTRALLRAEAPPTAICAGNDAIAIAVIDAARGTGVQVPQQLSVVGFDDLPVASVVTPNLTTIRQPLRDIGECATGLLIAQLRCQATPDDERSHLLSPELIVRGSTATVPRVTTLLS